MAVGRIEYRVSRSGTGGTGALWLFVLGTLTLWLWPGAALAAGAGGIAPSALAEIQALEQEKLARTPAQQKLDSNLIYARKKLLTGTASLSAPRLQPDVKIQPDGRVLVDITATVSVELLSFIKQIGGQAVSSFAQYNQIRALVPLRAIESLAERADVHFVSRAHEGRTNLSNTDPEGDICHEANLARTTFGADGTGVKVGVLSNGDDSNAVAVALGDLPGNVTTLAGQSGAPSDGEGTAMLEVIYRLAPGAQLYYATGLPPNTSLTNLPASEGQMASNILALAAAGCKIIVDDIAYPDESPFQEGQPIARAVQTVSDQGVLYFSCARNSGNEDSGKSGTWEGDFADGGATGPPISGIEAGRVHNFGGGTNYDTVTVSNSPSGDLFWSDPLGASTNDYDLFVLDSSGVSVAASSTTTQSGTQDPYEHVNTLSVGQRIVIVKHSGADRFLHLDTGRSQIALNTAGCIRGHNCSSAANAFCVAATPAASAAGSGNPTGPYPNPFTGGTANFVEFFSADGPRHLFYYPDGTPITPGNFSSTGGKVLAKPDFTAADGVSTSLPFNGGLNPFFGTSCAAPHAAAIAALLLSYNPGLTLSQVRTALTNTALPLSNDSARTAGAGIIMAYQALASVSANSWTNAASGKWEVGANWSVGKAPDSFHTIVISNAPTKTVTIDATTSGSFATNLTMLSLTVSAPTGSTNTLWLNNAGTAKPLAVITGQGASPESGDLILDGNGVLVVNGSAVRPLGNLIGGNAGGSSLLVITNGGTVTNKLGYLGFNASSGNNSVVVSGGGSVWNSTNDLEIGQSGAGNRLTITSGGVVYDNYGNLGFDSSSSSNTAVVNGSGSLWSNRNEVNVGVSGSGNRLVVTNGGTVVDGFGVLGFYGSSSNNSVVVSGNGSLWNNQSELYVGQNGAGNQLSISSNGVVLAKDVYLGLASTNPGNRITITGGSLYATNGLGSGALDIRNGTLTINSGAVTGDKLLATNGANSVIQFNGGTLSSGGSSVVNGQILAVGNGSSAATFNLIGGAYPNFYGAAYSFANGLEIRSNAFLTGCGTIYGNVTIDGGGTVQADCGDTLNFFGTVTNSGTITALNGTFINFYGSVVNSGVINGGGGNVQFFSTVQNSGTLLTNNMAARPVLTNLYSFTGGADGASPYAGLVQASDGNFYGTTLYGGTNNYGTVFCVTPAGAFTNLHRFTATDGAYPYYAVLAQGSDGFLYGTAYSGGQNGLGTVFKMTTAGALAWWYNFAGVDGDYPYAGLVQASDGYFYGTTFQGGSSYNPGFGNPGQGTVFRISSAGAFTSLHSLTVFEGLYPAAPLVQGSDGNFYGSTGEGGIGSGCLNNCGTVFKITSAGALTSLLASASNPRGGFVQGSDGLFYGTASGVSEVPARSVRNDGAVFRMNSAGASAVLHGFTNFVGEGANPYAGLVQGSDGNFYGTTQKGGIANTGTVFRITTSGALTTLCGFSGGADGGSPAAPLVQGVDGNFYGTTTSGGVFGWGTVFKLSFYLVPPANQLARITGIQVAGTNVVVTITSIAGKGYQLQYRSSLSSDNWSNVVGAATNGFGGPLLLTDHAGPLPAQRLYRVVITP